MITHDKDVRVSIGAYLHGNKNPNEKVHRLLTEELTGLNTYVKYIHTKFMLIDPLSDTPLLISGSANFSKNSTINNDENMLLIKGDKRVADIYLGEFMRLFNHFYFRDIANRQSARSGSKTWASSMLEVDDSWARPYFQSGSIKEKERLFYAWKKRGRISTDAGRKPVWETAHYR